MSRRYETCPYSLAKDHCLLIQDPGYAKRAQHLAQLRYSLFSLTFSLVTGCPEPSRLAGCLQFWLISVESNLL